MELQTTYLGFDLAHPLIPGASPLTADLDIIKRLEDAGAPMLVLPSLFEEELHHRTLSRSAQEAALGEDFTRELGRMPESQRLLMHPEDYLDHIFRVKQVVDVPVVASLNGTTQGGWVRYARQIEDAGADALELNFYDIATEANITSREIELSRIEIVRELASVVALPIAIKLSPFYTSIPNMAAHYREAGADALVIFNRFYQPEVDLEGMGLGRTLELSNPSELNLRLRWTAILSSRVNVELAVTGGVHRGTDALKAIACGATACQTVSSLLQRGPGHLSDLVQEMRQWLETHGHANLASLRGQLSMNRVGDNQGLVRANYFRNLRGYNQRMEAADA